MKFSLSIDWPLIKDLDLHRGKVLKAAGREVAKRVKKRLRQGAESDGKAVSRAKDKNRGRKPLRRTGELIKSIKPGRRARKKQRMITIAPRGKRTDGKSNTAVMGWLQSRRGLDLMGLNEADKRAVQAAVRKEIRKQLGRSKRGGLVTRRKRIVGKGRARR